MRAIAGALALGRLNTIASGVSHIPASGPALIVARHYHHLFDGLALFAAIPRRFHIVVTLDWAKTRRTKYFMEALTRIARWPVLLRADAPALHLIDSNRLFSQNDVRRYQRRAMRDAIDLLAGGNVLVVFPEGYPKIDPHFTPKKNSAALAPFKSGFAAMATAAERRLGAAIPIIPVGIHFTRETKWTAHLNIGTAVYAKDFASRYSLVAHVERQVATLSALSQA